MKKMFHVGMASSPGWSGDYFYLQKHSVRRNGGNGTGRNDTRPVTSLVLAPFRFTLIVYFDSHTILQSASE